MKLRSGFVSNSSSSSFIIAYKEDEKTCSKCKRTDISIAVIKEAIEHSSYEQHSWDHEGYEEVLKSAKAYTEEPDIEKRIEVLHTQGYKFAQFELCHHDALLNKLITENHNILIIYSEGH